MYEVFYNLKAEPFRLSPDHKFCYEHNGYAKARAYMSYAFKRAEGFVMITGRPGTGKTTLIGELVESFSTDSVKTANLVCTQLEADDLLKTVAFSFGLSSSNNDKAEILQNLTRLFERWHHEGRRALLIVDEAQDLSQSALEELRLLTNIQIGGQPLLQIFLLGQPELRDLVMAPEMEQVHQRVIAASHLRGLEVDETEAYVVHRLQTAGWQGDPAIDCNIFPLIHKFSEGVPRRINLICSRLLLLGSVEGRHAIEVEDVRDVIGELQAENLAAGTWFSESDFDLSAEPRWLEVPTDVDDEFDAAMEADEVIEAQIDPAGSAELDEDLSEPLSGEVDEEQADELDAGLDESEVESPLGSAEAVEGAEAEELSGEPDAQATADDNHEAKKKAELESGGADEGVELAAALEDDGDGLDVQFVPESPTRFAHENVADDASAEVNTASVAARRPRSLLGTGIAAGLLAVSAAGLAYYLDRNPLDHSPDFSFPGTSQRVSEKTGMAASPIATDPTTTESFSGDAVDDASDSDLEDLQETASPYADSNLPLDAPEVSVEMDTDEEGVEVVPPAEPALETESDDSEHGIEKSSEEELLAQGMVDSSSGEAANTQTASEDQAVVSVVASVEADSDSSHNALAASDESEMTNRTFLQTIDPDFPVVKQVFMINFDSESAELPVESLSVLDRAVDKMLARPDSVATIAESRMARRAPSTQLDRIRAVNVEKYLRDSGVSESRMQRVRSLAESDPIAAPGGSDEAQIVQVVVSRRLTR